MQLILQDFRVTLLYKLSIIRKLHLDKMNLLINLKIVMF